MSNLDTIISSLQWSVPQMVQGKAVVKAIPNQAFWNLWRFDKNEIKAQGIFVRKEKGTYIVYRAIPMSVVYSSKRLPNNLKKKQKLFFSKQLLQYQKKHTLGLVKAICKHGSALDGSDTGTGKTFCALTVAKEIKRKPFAICSKSGKKEWRNAAEELEVEGLITINYEKLKRWKTDYLIKLPSKDDQLDLEWLVPSDEYILIWDEVHRCKSYKSINSKMLIQATQQGYLNLMLSATIADNPMQLKAVGFALNLFPREEDFWPWIKANGCDKNEYDAYEFCNSDRILTNIHKSIYTEKGSRIKVSELGDMFPKNKVISTSYTMDNAKKIQRIHESIAQMYETLKFRKSLDGESHLTELLRARQEIELLKVPTFVEMAEDLLEEGHSVILFMNFTDTIKVLMEKLNTNCVVWGEQKGKKGLAEREYNIDAFQNDNARIIICNIGAGGESISLHDKNGKYSRVTLISPTWSAQALKQCLGRAPRAKAKTPVVQKIIFAADTVEENVAIRLAEKVDRINVINDGDLDSSIRIQISEE